MTEIYFIRHAESDITVTDGRTRPLTTKGMADRRLVTDFLKDKNVDAVFSSPYKRAVDTVSDFAQKFGFEIETDEDFRERRSDGDWDRKTDYFALMERQWADFSYTLSDGECLAEVQERNIAALKRVLARYSDKTVTIGTHGTALSTIVNYFDNSYGFKDFMAMVGIMPWVVKMYFVGDDFAGLQKIDLFLPDSNGAGPAEYIVQTCNFGGLKAYRFVVIFARYRDRWLYCHTKGRDFYETAGGHIEPGETPLDAARRELYEETGATAFDIEPAFDYSVHVGTAYSFGQVFFARVHELGEIPIYENAVESVELFDAIPGRMRFPQILPVLYERMQKWLNLQSAKDEIWDVYDSERRLAGRTHRRADPLPAGDFHLVVHVWLLNGAGEFLITRRAPNKGYPNMWECTGGSALAGDDSLAAAVREVKEEIGLEVAPENGECVFTFSGESDICDVWLFRQDFDIGDAVLQENETTGAKYASAGEIRRMAANGEFCNFHYIEELFEKVLYGK